MSSPDVAWQEIAFDPMDRQDAGAMSLLLRTTGLFAITLVGACSSPQALTDGGKPATTNDAAIDGAVVDAGADAAVDAAVDASTLLPTIAEKEPNDGKTTTEIQDVTVPAIVTGVIDPVGDVDGFRAQLTSGDLFTWKVEATGADLTPYLGIVEKDDSVPHFVARAPKGQSVEMEQFVTKSSAWHIIVTDSSNVKGNSFVGGPTFGYKVTAQRVARVPKSVALGGTEAAALGGPYAVGVFALSLTSTTALDINVRAKRLSTPSDLDTRLSIVNKDDGLWIATNDDMASGQSDSKLGADALPAGNYVLVVENVNPDAKILTFEIAVTKR